MDLSGFLLARIAEDEAVSRAAVERNGATWSTYDLDHNGVRITGTTEFGNPRAYRGDDALWDDEGALGMFEETAAHVVRHDPARVLAECDAKRRIVELCQRLEHKRMNDNLWNIDEDEEILAALALPYANHPDYREEWKP
jgi:hypothetical protein